MPRIERAIRVMGVFLLFAGVLANPVFVAYVASPDHTIESPLVKVAVIAFQAVLIIAGLFCFLRPKTVVRALTVYGKNVLLFIIVYLLGEVVVMASGIFLPPRATPERVRYFQEFLADNDQLGYTTGPNLNEFEVTWLEDQVRGVYSSDEHGFRNPGVDYAQARLFFIGDSFTHGSWVDREKTYYGVIGEQLNEPVVSFGVGGYGLAQYQVLARDFIPENENEKIVVIGMFANDFEKPIPPEKLASLYEDDMLANVKKEPWRHRFQIRYSALGQIKRLLFRGREFATLPNGMRLYTNRGASISFRLTDHEPFRETLTAIFDTLAARRDVRQTIVVLIPSRELVYRDAFEREFGNAAFLENEAFGFQLVKDAAAAYDTVSVVDLLETFREERDTEKLYFDIDAHWNEAGHRRAAEAILAHPSFYGSTQK